MKKGLWIFLEILRFIAVLTGVIYIWKHNKIFFSISAVIALLVLIIETINSIVYHRQIRWLFIVPLSSLVPVIVIGTIGMVVVNTIGISDLDDAIIMGSIIVVSAFWFIFEIINHKRAKKIVKERHRYDDYYDDYYDDHHDNYRY